MMPNLEFMETLARGAGEILRAGFGTQHRVDHKGEIDLVTEMDHRSEAYLLKEIHRRCPGHRVVAEESGDSGGRVKEIWYVDPLDGTVNYAHGIPIYSVSLAFARAGTVTLAAVYDPMQDECFSAELGRGVWLNGEPIEVSDCRDLDRSLLVTGFPYDVRTNPENNLDNYAYFTLCTRGVRRLGSAALDLCYVATGRFDGFWEIRLSPWDVAAGALIAQEAGALVTDLVGGPDYLSAPQSIVAANPHLHPQILSGLKNGAGG
jgi:myo-inositol-1(or 4)-monophosphatase